MALGETHDILKQWTTAAVVVSFRRSSNVRPCQGELILRMEQGVEQKYRGQKGAQRGWKNRAGSSPPVLGVIDTGLPRYVGVGVFSSNSTCCVGSTTAKRMPYVVYKMCDFFSSEGTKTCSLQIFDVRLPRKCRRLISESILFNAIQVSIKYLLKDNLSIQT